jgi:hypothetical protein
MRPDTYQVYEDIHIEKITGRSGTLISMAPWRQFFDLGGSKEKPFAIVRNITFSNIKVKTKSIGEIVGNPSDKVSKILFKDSDITAESVSLINKNPDVKFQKVIVNGKPFVYK